MKKEIAIACVDLQLRDQLARHIDSISKNLLKELKAHPDLLDILAESRRKCFHFGEDAFDSYIDVTWYFKTLVRYLKRFYENKKLIKKAESLIVFLEDKYIVENYIGKSRARYLRPIASSGGHGVSIYFPVGRKDRYDNHILWVPFIKGSPFQVEFVKNKWNDLISLIIERLKNNPMNWVNRL